MENTDRTPRELLQAITHDCPFEHVGERSCPECDEHHKQLTTLPDRPLHSLDMEKLGRNGLPATHAYRVHLDDPALPAGYLKYSPAIFLVHNGTIQYVEYTPNTGWVIVERHEVENDLEAETEIMRQRIIERVNEKTDLPFIDNDPRP